MKLIALGVWGGYPTKETGTTSFLLQSESGFNLLIDCGSRAVTELERELLPTQLDAVIISHYHEDHIADLGVLRQYRQLFPEKSPILPIYGHKENQYEFDKLTLENVSEGRAYDTGSVNSIGPFDVTFLKTVHPVVCYAMRIKERESGKILVYTGDTGYFKSLIDFAQEVELLLADVYFFKDKSEMPNHLSSVEAGQIAQKAAVKKLVLTHLPQVGDLEVLRQEAQNAAPAVKVELAAAHKSWNL